MTPEQKEAVARVSEWLKDELSSLSREAKEAESAAFHSYLALGPRIHCGGPKINYSEQVALRARSEAGAYDAAKIIAAEFIERGEQLPENLARFIAQVLRGEAVRPDHSQGRRKDTDLRNRILAHAVWSLEVAGIPPTKAVGSKRLCGCDIVAGIYNEIVRPNCQAFKAATMLDIWLNDPEVKIQREWLAVLPR